jgi:hypothetical protein
MLEDNAIHRRTAMVIIRHGERAADFAAMIARELAKVGNDEESQAWWSVSRAAQEILSGVVSPPSVRPSPCHPTAA